jgi:outer membrane protein assembly factor BamA
MKRYSLDPRYVFVPRDKFTFAIGPTFAWSRTTEAGVQFVDEVDPYGAGEFGSVGLSADLTLDRRDRARSPTGGFLLQLGGTAWPAILDVEEAFARARFEASAYLSPWKPLQPTIALRVGGERLSGTFPFHESAFVGDEATVRLGRKQRYAGDAMAYANAELRTRLGRAKIVLPADFGILGIADVGRVWFEDEDSNEWHTAFGGGMWLGFISVENALTLTFAKSAERTGIYIGGGFAF